MAEQARTMGVTRAHSRAMARTSRKIRKIVLEETRALGLDQKSRSMIASTLAKLANEPGRNHPAAGEALECAARLVGPANPKRALKLLAEAGEHYAHSANYAHKAAEIFARLAALAGNNLAASEFREKAGDAYHADRCYVYAEMEYRSAARLVRKTDPERARMLDEKAKEAREYPACPSVTGYQGYLGY